VSGFDRNANEVSFYIARPGPKDQLSRAPWTGSWLPTVPRMGLIRFRMHGSRGVRMWRRSGGLTYQSPLARAHGPHLVHTERVSSSEPIVTGAPCPLEVLGPSNNPPSAKIVLPKRWVRIGEEEGCTARRGPNCGRMLLEADLPIHQQPS